MKKTALVTGASRGIGAAIARQLAHDGWAVAVNYFSSEDSAKALVEQLRQAGHSAMAVRADVADGEQVADMVARVQGQMGDIHALVNNAGVAWQGLFGDCDEGAWDKVMDVNLKGAYWCSRAVLPGMIARRSGHIVNISSIWGITGASCEVAYSAAKAGLIGFSKALALEVAPSRVQVNCVAPGIIDTDMMAGFDAWETEALREQIPAGRLGTPGDIAAVVGFLCRAESGYITGQVISPNGGFIT